MDLPRTYDLTMQGVQDASRLRDHPSAWPTPPREKILEPQATCSPVVERMARAICLSATRRSCPGSGPDYINDKVERGWRAHVEHALSALESMEPPTQEMLTAMGSTPGVAALTALAEAAGRAGLSHPGIPAVGQPSVMEQAWRAALGAAREAPAPKLAPVEGDEVLVRGAHRAALLGTRKDALEGLVAWVVYFTSADGPQGYDTVPYTSLVRR